MNIIFTLISHFQEAYMHLASICFITPLFNGSDSEFSSFSTASSIERIVKFE